MIQSIEHALIHHYVNQPHEIAQHRFNHSSESLQLFIRNARRFIVSEYPNAMAMITSAVSLFVTLQTWNNLSQRRGQPHESFFSTSFCHQYFSFINQRHTSCCIMSPHRSSGVIILFMQFSLSSRHMTAQLCHCKISA